MGSTTGASRFGASRSFMFGLLPGAQVDYQRLAGDTWKNPVIAAAIGWIGRNLPQAQPATYRQLTDGTEQIVARHPLTDLRKRPNPYYDGRTLLQATMLSLICAGNAFWWIKRAGPGGIPVELWYLAHYDVWPVWSRTSTTDDWIIGYQYRNNGEYMFLANEQVVHFRDGLDPEYQRMGLNLLRSASREVVADNEASAFHAALLRNMGVVGHLISPRDPQATISSASAEVIKEQFGELTQGDNRGRPVVLDGTVDVVKLGSTPSDMGVAETQRQNEARLCAMIGINPVVLGLPSGLEHATYSNMEEAERSAWRNGIVPRLELINSEMDTQLLTVFPGSESLRCGTDYSRVIALQDSLDDLYARNKMAVGGPWLTANEARANAGLKPIKGGDELYKPGALTPDNAPDATRHKDA